MFLDKAAEIVAQIAQKKRYNFPKSHAPESAVL